MERNGSKHKIHANQLRKFYCRAYKVSCNVTLTITASCNSALIYEKDSDFGQVIMPETTSVNTNVELPSMRIEESKLAHLQPQQRAELLSLLDKYADCFLDVPGFCRLSEHAIPLLDSFVPKRLPPYKIPVKIRDEVQKQLNNLEKTRFNL